MPRILIVEDDLPIAQALEMLFEDEGYAVRLAHDGAEALAALEREPADVVLADIHMPVIDGLALLKELSLRSSPVPVVLMSAGSSVIQVGVPFIAKPFDPHELLTAIERALR